MREEETVFTELTGWGCYPRTRARLVSPADVGEVAVLDADHLIARGQGRSYGTAATLDGGTVMLSSRLNKVISFDTATGILTAEAGLTLAEIIEQFLPLGWFPPATPGTRFVSLGGCVAADVHGKGHHIEGSFGNHVKELELVLANGERCACSAERLPDLFWATVGGMGLTGIITRVTVQLRPIAGPMLEARHHSARNLEQLMGLFERTELDDDFSVAWIDCMTSGESLGRGVYMAAHSTDAFVGDPKRKKRLGITNPAALTVPFDMPSWVLNPLTTRMFNAIYYRVQGKSSAPFLVGFEDFFYPLDKIGNWNRLYGKRGFLQYQCVFPEAGAHKGLRLVLSEIAAARQASFLAVLKKFGPEGKGFLTFPMAGYTLALDMPVTGPSLFEMLKRLDRIVIDHGGRVYLAKEARLGAPEFRAMYPRLDQWLGVKAAYDPHNRFTSDLAKQLEIV